LFWQEKRSGRDPASPTIKPNGSERQKHFDQTILKHLSSNLRGYTVKNKKKNKK